MTPPCVLHKHVQLELVLQLRLCVGWCAHAKYCNIARCVGCSLCRNYSAHQFCRSLTQPVTTCVLVGNLVQGLPQGPRLIFAQHGLDLFGFSGSLNAYGAYIWAYRYVLIVVEDGSYDGDFQSIAHSKKKTDPWGCIWFFSNVVKDKPVYISALWILIFFVTTRTFDFWNLPSTQFSIFKFCPIRPHI